MEIILRTTKKVDVFHYKKVEGVVYNIINVWVFFTQRVKVFETTGTLHAHTICCLFLNICAVFNFLRENWTTPP